MSGAQKDAAGAAAPKPLAPSELAALVDSVPRPTAEQLSGHKPLSYGTAGFRAREFLLDSVCLRMGMMAALRSMKLGVPVGIMVTASHNQVVDNGLKLADGDGGMLHASWEPYAMEFERAPTGEDLVTVIQSLREKEGIPEGGATPVVYIGMDTRPHSPRLKDLACRGARAIGAEVRDIGVVTTPQLHHVVYSKNRGEEDWASKDGYYAKVEDAFRKLLRSAGGEGEGKEATCAGKLVIDCACGVGSIGIAPLVGSLSNVLEIEVRNPVDEPGGELNGGCGAEFVQKKRLPPRSTDADADAGVRFASFDGDADRVVYFFFDKRSQNSFTLLDGDKIAVLTAQFVAEELAAAGLGDEVRVGIVQTAYANGAAHKCVLASGIDCPYAKTGVKYCHHKAVEYDIGIYYEANGHGTAIFKDAVVERFREARAAPGCSGRAATALDRLLATAQLYNQAVGDAICDALFVEACLTIRGMDVCGWDGLYHDLPSRQTKVKVQDRKVVVPLPDETAVVSPEALKGAIEAAVAAVDADNGRAFARPSGTEDVVRVYAEASSQELADDLAARVATAIFEHAGGVGEAPQAGQWK